MWTRAELKDSAKNVLKSTYWMGFGVSILCAFLSDKGSQFINTYYRISVTFHTFSISFFLLLIIFAIVFGIFISNPVVVGSNVYFMRSRTYTPIISDTFSCFRKGIYLKIVKNYFLLQLYIALWSLLLIIPGIIKTYQYFFVPYILSENPTISLKRALEISRNMTNGIKWRIFVLQLSFIGWILVGFMLCCVGVLFVNPYIHATFAELYALLRENALAEGYADTSELCGF